MSPVGESLHYSVAVKNDGKDDPGLVVEFDVTREQARCIVHAARIVTATGFLAAQMADAGARYYRDTAGHMERGREPADVDSSVMNVSATQFWYSAFDWEGEEEIRSVKQSVAALAKHFGIRFRAPTA